MNTGCVHVVQRARKCLRAGNDEFARAGESILAQIEALDLPEARAFLSEFLPSFRLTMDELN